MEKYQWTIEDYKKYRETGIFPQQVSPQKPQQPIKSAKSEKIIVSPKTLPEDRLNVFNALKFRLEEGKAIWLPGNTPSLKNSKEIGQKVMGKYTLREHVSRMKSNNKSAQALCPNCSKLSIVKMIPTLRSSETVEKYKAEFTIEYTKNTSKFREVTKGIMLPYFLGIYFIRKQQNMFDLINACQIVQDMAKEAGWFDDDNASILFPVFLGWHWDKENAGCIVAPLTNYLPTVINCI